ncbi:MAG: hypothetical protein GXO21_03720 [Aquificae bacterium]|nr:hypothetical protein [Aquificota bacterium]
MKYEKTFSTFIDVLKGLSIGSFVASIVGFVLQKNESSWILIIFGFIFLVISLLLSFFFDRLSEEKDE